MPKYSCQNTHTLSTVGLMLSGPLALLIQVLVSCRLTWLEVIVMTGVVGYMVRMGTTILEVWMITIEEVKEGSACIVESNLLDNRFNSLT